MEGPQRLHRVTQHYILLGPSVSGEVGRRGGNDHNHAKQQHRVRLYTLIEDLEHDVHNAKPITPTIPRVPVTPYIPSYATVSGKPNTSVIIIAEGPAVLARKSVSKS